MNLNFLGGLLGIVKTALQNPEDKAAVQIAQDALAFWEDIATHPTTLKLEADIGAYGKLVEARQPAPAPMPLDAPQPYIAPARQSPSDFNANSTNREAST